MHHAWQFALLIVFTKQKMELYFTPKIFVLDVVIVFMLVLLEHLNFLRLEILVLVGKWISVLSVLVDLKMMIPKWNFKNMVVIEFLKVNYLFVQRCVQLKHY